MLKITKIENVHWTQQQQTTHAYEISKARLFFAVASMSLSFILYLSYMLSIQLLANFSCVAGGSSDEKYATSLRLVWASGVCCVFYSTYTHKWLSFVNVEVFRLLFIQIYLRKLNNNSFNAYTIVLHSIHPRLYKQQRGSNSTK